jgi:rubrerythrin
MNTRLEGIDFLHIAMDIEEAFAEFYTKTAEMFKDNKELYRVFSALAREEQKHKAKLKEIEVLEAPALSDANADYVGKNWAKPKTNSDKLTVEDALLELSTTGYSELFLKQTRGILLKKAKKDFETIQDALSAVDFAINREQDSIYLYSEVKHLFNNKPKDFVAEVLDMERGHLRTLLGIRTYLGKLSKVDN